MIVRRPLAPIALLGATVMLACGGKIAADPPGDGGTSSFTPKGALVGGCETTSSGIRYCSEYYGTLDPSGLASSCAALPGGKWSPTGCPKLDRLGACANASETFTLLVWFYRPSPLDAGMIATACSASGQTFVGP